jgi:iron complex transport system substrate-binding protein
MKRILKIFALTGLAVTLVLMLALATGCSDDTQTEEPSTAFSVTDDRGIAYDFDEPVGTIVSLAPSNTEIVFFVEAGNELIARTDYCNFPAEVSSIESIGGFWQPDKERVVILDPDVVLATDMHVSSGDVEWLEAQGLKVVVLNPQTMDGIMDNIMLIGELTGNKDIASRKISDLEDRVNYITDRTSVLTDGQKPRVLHVTWHDPLWTVGTDNFLNTVIEMAGGTNIFTDVSGDVQVDIELAVTRNPQVITVVTGHGDAMRGSYDYIIAADSPFVDTDAYINDSVFLINADIATRSGPRIIEALELFAKFMHPEIFP